MLNRLLNMHEHTLIYAGLLPFIGLTGCQLLGITTIPLIGHTQYAFATYSLVIHSFMAGTHWTIGRQRKSSVHFL